MAPFPSLTSVFQYGRAWCDLCVCNCNELDFGNLMHGNEQNVWVLWLHWKPGHPSSKKCEIMQILQSRNYVKASYFTGHRAVYTMYYQAKSKDTYKTVYKWPLHGESMGGFPTQSAHYTDNVSISRRHHMSTAVLLSSGLISWQFTSAFRLKPKCVKLAQSEAIHIALWSWHLRNGLIWELYVIIIMPLFIYGCCNDSDLVPWRHIM